MTDDSIYLVMRLNRRIDLRALSARLEALNPHVTSIEAMPPTSAAADIRVLVRTTRKELQVGKGALRLTDPSLDGLQIETSLQMLDHRPGEKLQLQVKPTDPDKGVQRKMDA